MFTQKNGIFYQDGEPKLMIGTSYYPSFHKDKYPVPPEGDRIGVMREDMEHMSRFGFNQVRIAALGEISLDEDGNVVTDTAFVDEAVREAAKQGMTSSVRIQGYVTNLRGNTDYLMVNEKGEPMDGYWSAFITASLFHEGINRDTDDATKAIARHFASFPGVLSFQAYNEPHYPYNGIFDYHPKAIEAYKKWLSEKGLPESEPPRRRPHADESSEDWIRWRLFSMRAMSKFLCHSARLSSEVSGLENYTCATSSASSVKMMNGGLSYFDISEGMDVMGITTYVHFEGSDYYSACYVLDLAESAAATFGKHAWTVEADARTRMPGRKLHESVYAMVGAGHKGINFYEWKGDYPVEGSPNPDNCGFLFHDGKKAGHYETSRQMVQFLLRHSTEIAKMEKHRDGFGILYSEYAIAAADAHNELDVNLAMRDSIECYRDARKLGFCVDFTRACDLEKNPLKVKLLVVPFPLEYLSDEEKIMITRFNEIQGNAVYYKRTSCTFGAYGIGGFWRLDKPLGNMTRDRFDANPELYEVADEFGIAPYAKVSDVRLHPAVIEGEGRKIVTLVNSDTLRRDVSGACLTLGEKPKKATFMTPYDEIVCEIKEKTVFLPTVSAGGMVFLEY